MSLTYEEALKVLRDNAAGTKSHTFFGFCPDCENSSRDKDCEVCQALNTFDDHQSGNQSDKTDGFDRFDFEQAIFSVWNSVDDIKHVTDSADDSDNHDEIMSVLRGIHYLLEEKLNILFSQFESGVASRKII